MKALIEYYKARIQEVIYQKKFEAIAGASEEIVKSIKTKGYYVWENYLSEDECNDLCLRIDKLINDNSSKIWKDEEDADNRVYFAERLDEKILEFNKDKRFQNLADRYLNSNTSVLTTLAGRIQGKGNNKGSGGGWHRDTNMIHQFKSIVYLTDVDENNGPFEYIEGTQWKKTLFEFNQYGVGLDQNRISDIEADRILENGKYSKIQFQAKKGTCLLVDTSGIHRGKPLIKGNRYALTNYVYQDYFINSNMRNKFLAISPFREQEK